MARVVVATRSAGKLREISSILRAVGWEPVTLAALGVPESPDEDAVECHSTFRDNALAKARHFFARCDGLPVIADDSGLEVAALGGAPGVRSKRWSEQPDLSHDALDAANNARLIAALAGAGDRSARYVCEAAWVDRTSEHVGRGECAGSIVAEPRGANGFGYDPHFFSAELGKTFGEATLNEKAQVSHRARAMRALLALRTRD